MCKINLLEGCIWLWDPTWCAMQLWVRIFVCRPQEVVIFIVGGTTYEESRSVALQNASNVGVRFILGGSVILNSRRFLKDLEEAQRIARSSTNMVWRSDPLCGNYQLCCLCYNFIHRVYYLEQLVNIIRRKLAPSGSSHAVEHLLSSSRLTRILSCSSHIDFALGYRKEIIFAWPYGFLVKPQWGYKFCVLGENDGDSQDQTFPPRYLT